MSTWDDFPADYRSAEVRAIHAAVKAGECVAVSGLSGAGKSNLLGYLAGRQPGGDQPQYVLVDGNRLPEHSAAGFLRLMRLALEPPAAGQANEYESDALASLEVALAGHLARGICFLLDLSLLLDREGRLLAGQAPGLWGNLRALRDRHKFAVTYVVATRHALPLDNELAELFFGHTLRLGALTEADARWNVARYAARMGQAWGPERVARLLELSGRYPALLRGVCEACAAGTPLTLAALAQHEAIAARVAEFWADQPSPAEVTGSGLAEVALLKAAQPAGVDTAQLTAKENRLLLALQARAGEVCEKDDLIRAVWPEDQILETGVRDDSLAQLARRLREKIEVDAGHPRLVLTVPGRGYRWGRSNTGPA